MKLVLKVLQLNGWMMQADIAKETYLSPRTVKCAIRNLREKKVIKEKPNLDDLRKSITGTRNKTYTHKEPYKPL